MYSNAGKSIKDIVTKVVVFQMIISILLALVVFFARIGDGGLIIGILVGVLGCFSAWLSGLVLYAYGDIADNLSQINSKLDKGGEKTSQGKFSRSQTSLSDGSHLKVDSTVPKVVDTSSWICAQCQTSNQYSAACCYNCGATRAWSDEMRRK